MGDDEGGVMRVRWWCGGGEEGGGVVEKDLDVVFFAESLVDVEGEREEEVVLVGG